jgi:hypothetical protein
MAQSPREGQQTQKEEERPGEATGTSGRHGGGVQRQTERVVEVGRERMQQATEATAAAASGALRSGSAVAGDAQEIAAAWARYAEEVMRHTSEASQALLRARTFAEMLEVQAKLLRDNMQSFLDQSTRIAEAAGRMATRPFGALKEASGDKIRG